jgi:hypothetical protein
VCGREKYEARKEEKLPWIASPLKNVEGHSEFSQREEASKIELFYDLFFVANLTTFTAVHEINDRKGNDLSRSLSTFNSLRSPS